MLEVRADEHHFIEVKTLRQFAVAALVFCSMLGLWLGVRHGNFSGAIALVIVGIFVGIRGVLNPSKVEVLFRFLTALTLPIGLVMTKLLIAVLFYGLFTPMGWCMRLFSWDPLQTKWDPDLKTHWKPAEKPGNYFKQS